MEYASLQFSCNSPPVFRWPFFHSLKWLYSRAELVATNWPDSGRKERLRSEAKIHCSRWKIKECVVNCLAISLAKTQHPHPAGKTSCKMQMREIFSLSLVSGHLSYFEQTKMAFAGVLLQETKGSRCRVKCCYHWPLSTFSTVLKPN